ncbi:MAG: phosphocarrier protein HPr [SAR324 cluster bacterium]|uniref:Phosphocarrier protein HPr n=1 Tax=SAR324 cluster bacterium TaxID=2024889 RepID=A0A2A4T8S2_9DELT|nr:MAG: phosphocarrier protein HPr [SAR324 cluster bacterium]
MVEKELTIINKLGLHVRAASQLVKMASDFDGEVTIACNGQSADAQSIMEVLMLAATIDTEVVLSASGDSEEEEQEIIDSLSVLINNRFNEQE